MLKFKDIFDSDARLTTPLDYIDGQNYEISEYYYNVDNVTYLMWLAAHKYVNVIEEIFKKYNYDKSTHIKHVTKSRDELKTIVNMKCGREIYALKIALINTNAGIQEINKTRSIHEIEILMIRLVKLLIKAGADINAKNEYGDSLLHIISFDYCFCGIEKKYVSMEKVFKLLITEGANVNAKNSTGATPLHYGAHIIYCGTEELSYSLIKLLIKSGANINDKDDDGDTPLHSIIWNVLANENFGEYIKYIKLLIEEGSDVNIRNKDGLTPLGDFLIYISSEKDFSIQKITQDQKNIITILLDAGTNIDDLDYKPKGMIYDIMLERKNNEIRKLEEEIKKLNVQIDYSPGGIGYKETEEHFRKMKENL